MLFVPKENMNVHDVPRGDAAAPQRLCGRGNVEMKSLKSSSEFGEKGTAALAD